jgi:hypothetical protein
MKTDLSFLYKGERSFLLDGPFLPSKPYPIPEIAESEPPELSFDIFTAALRRPVSMILNPWKDICNRHAYDDSLSLGQGLTSPPEDIPRPKTDLSTLPPLNERVAWEDGRKCMKCNVRGRGYLKDWISSRDAYVDLQKGMLGTGESEYSRLLTQYYKECLENFCAYEKVEDCADKFDFYINEIRKRVIFPDYPVLKLVLSHMAIEAELRAQATDAIRLRRELIFVTMLQGRQNNRRGEPIPRSFCVPLEAEISNSMEERRSPMATVSGSIDK